jgi:radical SAM superfamily enzyme YgiQ (UPF0313 family)
LSLDFIIDNPYETKDDIIQTYRYIIELSPQVRTNIFCLIFLPGTPMYDRAVKDAIIEPYDAKVFRSFLDWATRGYILYQKNYETFLVVFATLLRRRIPRFVLRALGSRPVRGIAPIFPKSFYAILIKVFLKRLFPMLYRLRYIAQRHVKLSSRAIELDPNLGSLYFSRGLACERQGKKAMAIANFKKCISLSKNPQLIRMAGKLIEELSK